MSFNYPAYARSSFFSSFSVVRPTQFLGIITKKRGKGKEKETTSFNFLTLINSFNWKMSIITKFPGIRGSVVYPFFYEIDHYIFCHIEFVSIWWLSCLERHAYLLARPFFIAPYFEGPATQLCLVVFKLHRREPTFLFVNCTWKLNERWELTCSVLVQKYKVRGFSERLGKVVGLGLVSVHRFTGALSKTKG